MLAANAGSVQRTVRRAGPKVLFGAGGLAACVIIGIAGLFLAPADPTATGNAILQAPSGAHLLGTTETGQDVFSQMMAAGAPTLLVAFIAAGVATVLSVLVGVMSGYLRGSLAELMTLVTNIFLVLPVLPLLIVVTGYLSNDSNLVLALVIGLTGWAFGARVIRAQTLSIAARDHVTAARAVGEGTARVVLFELLPDLVPLIASTLLLTTVFAMGTQAGLLFLGLGDISQWTWGSMLYWAQNGQAFTQGAWWWYVPPGLAISLVGLFLSLLNFGIDDRVNTRLRGVKAGRERRSLRRAVRRTPSTDAPERPEHEQPCASSGEDEVLRVEHLTASYGRADGEFAAVIDVTFAVRRGEIFGLAGESGSGKSTLLHAVTSLLPPAAQVTAGRVTYRPAGGAPVSLLDLSGERLRQVRWAGIAIVFQSAMNALNPVMTVGDQIVDVMSAHGRCANDQERYERAASLLSKVGVSADRLRAYPHELSGGMRQRAMIAMALALDPEILVMDEPTTALDVVTQRQIVEQVMALRDDLGLSVIFVTHDLALLLEIADRIAIMYAGRLVEIGVAEHMLASPAHPYTKGLLGSFPTLDAQRGAGSGIPGSPPDMRELGPGCAFRPRCGQAGAACEVAVPGLRAVPSEPDRDRLAACHLIPVDGGGSSSLSASRAALDADE